MNKHNRSYWHLLTITGPLGCYSSLPLHVSSLFLLWRHAGVPGRPEITGFTKPAMEGDVITLTCTTSGSKPAANIRWFRNDKEVQGERVARSPPSGAPALCFHLRRLRDFITVKLLGSADAAALRCAWSCALFLHPQTALAGATTGLAGGHRCHCVPCTSVFTSHCLTEGGQGSGFSQDRSWLHAVSWESITLFLMNQIKY